MSDHINVTTEDGVRRIRIAREDKKNAITPDMYAALSDAFATAGDDAEIRAVLLEGGDEAFSAGNDLSSFNFPSDDQDVRESPAWQFLEAVTRCPLPVVAAVSGPAVGIGVTVLLHCDLVYADESAFFQTPFVDLAAVPEGAASWFLPRHFGRQIAAEFLLLCDRVSAARAERMGLVNAVVSDGPVRDHAFGIASQLAQKPPMAMRKAKALMHDDRDDWMAHMEREFREFGECVRSPEMQQVIAARMAGKR